MFHGILRANAIVTSANSLYTPGELAHQLADSGRQAALHGLAVPRPGAAPRSPRPGCPPTRWSRWTRSRASPRCADLLGHHGRAARARPSTADRHRGAALLVGHDRPRQGRDPHAPQPRREPACSSRAMGHRSASDTDRVLAVLPFFHIYGMTVLLNLACASGRPRDDAEVRPGRVPARDHPSTTAARTSTSPRRSPSRWPSTRSSTSTTSRRARRDLLRAPRRWTASWRHAAGQPHRAARMLQGYGMTELSPVIARDARRPPRHRPVSSVGHRCCPTSVCKLVDPATGEEIPDRRDGDGRRAVGARARTSCSATSTTPRRPPTPSTPTGSCTPATSPRSPTRACFSIVDRVKELIKYKGYQVAAGRARGAAARRTRRSWMPPSSACGTTTSEEIPKAFVVAAPDAELTEDDVMAFVAEHVAPHKKVRRVEFIDAIPKSSRGQDPAQGPPRPRGRQGLNGLLGDGEEAVPIDAEQVVVLRPAIRRSAIQPSTSAWVTPWRPLTNRAIDSMISAL